MTAENDTDRSVIAAELRDRYGRPKMVDAEVAMRALGVENVAPDDIAAFRYPSREAADAFAAANLTHFGHPTLAQAVVDGAVVGILDLRPAIEQMKAGTR